MAYSSVLNVRVCTGVSSLSNSVQPMIACGTAYIQLTMMSISGFGVHISFVRSITMDKWSDDQLKKMKVGDSLATTTLDLLGLC